MKPVNILEPLVFKLIEEQLKNHEGICTCPKCKADMAAITLNNIPPRYVVTDLGNCLAKTDLLDNQNSTILLVEVSKAIEYVSKNPKHEI